MPSTINSSVLLKERSIDLVQRLARKAKRSTQIQIEAELVGIDNALGGYVTIRVVDGKLGQKYKNRDTSGATVMYGGLDLQKLEPEVLLQIALKLI